jgi:hypothetical protein
MFNVILDIKSGIGKWTIMHKDTKSRIVYKNSMLEFSTCSNWVRQGSSLLYF